jgi:glycosyltransferase involved in cell wall biosynthesis
VKIICIGPAYPLRGGIADFNEQFSKHLLMHGYDTRIISYKMQYPKFLFPGKTQLTSSIKPALLDIESKIHSLNPINWRITAQYICSQQPDVVIIHYWMPFFAPALGCIAKYIRKHSSTKVIGLCHNLIPHERKPFDTQLTKCFTKHCDSFICMSKTVLQQLSEIEPTKKAILTPHPLYNNFGDLVSKEKACEILKLSPKYNYILFFGLIRKYKGLDLLLLAMGNPLIKQLPVKLLIAGEFYENPQIYTDLIHSLEIENNVIICNEFIPQQNVKYYFSASDIVAQTYHSASQSGITQIAFHFNKPMLVTNVGGLSEIVHHKTMGYVTDKDADDIAKCLHDFFINNRKESFSQIVAQEKHKYSWETCISNVSQLF